MLQVHILQRGRVPRVHGECAKCRERVDEEERARALVREGCADLRATRCVRSSRRRCAWSVAFVYPTAARRRGERRGRRGPGLDEVVERVVPQYGGLQEPERVRVQGRVVGGAFENVRDGQEVMWVVSSSELIVVDSDSRSTGPGPTPPPPVLVLESSSYTTLPWSSTRLPGSSSC